MAVIPIRDVPGEAVEPSGNELILIDNGIAMQKATINDAVTPKASEIADQKIADLNLGTASQANVEDFATAAQGDLADSAVQPTREIIAGTGLTGGGNLSADRTISLDASSIASLAKADTAVQSVVAGANVTVDATDPQNPIISASGGGGAGTDFATVAALLADNNDKIGYAGSGADTEVLPGEIVTAQGYRYEVEASDATDWDVATAGGVKLYVLTQHKRLYAAAFGLEADTGADVTLLSQKVIDALPSGRGITLVIPAGRYKVSKNNALANYPGNDQPCLEFRGKKNFRVEAEGAVFYCETHAQGVLEFQLCEDGEIVGLMTEGAGNFPPLDGTTGRGEKGVSSAGFNTSGFQGYYKNNSHDTSANTGGGYGGAFPQWGGGTASSWGMWNGGYIGNTGSGILIHNGCKRLTLTRCGGTGFNRAGIQVGFLGDYWPTDRGYEDSEQIALIDCICNENYDSGIDYSAVAGMRIQGGETCRNGHPDASITDDNCDPGYGSTSRSNAYSQARDVVINGVTANDNKRKGIDAHGGDSIKVIANTVKRNLVMGIFMDWTSAQIPIEQSIVAFNDLEDNAVFVGSGLGQIYVGGELGGDLSTPHAIVTGNQIKGGRTHGIVARYGDGYIITDNIIGEISGETSSPYQAIALIGNVGTSRPISGSIVSRNRIYSEKRMGGILASYADDCIISENIVTLTGTDVTSGISTGNTYGGVTDVMNNRVSLGAVGTPYALATAGGSCYGNKWKGGNQPPLLKSLNKGSLAVADTLAFTVTFNGTATPTVSDVVGGDISVSATSIAQGVRFSFSGAIPSNTGLHGAATVEILSSDGLATNGDNVGLIYTRSISGSGLDLGIKVTWGGGHTQASDLVSGSMRVTVSYR